MVSRPFRLFIVFLAITTLSLGLWAAPEGSPNVTSCSPNTGPTAGATTVNIGGSSFATSGTVQVDFGGQPATSVFVVNATLIQCVTPAHTAGTIDITVTNPDMTSGVGPQMFTYQGPAPTLTIVNPNSGTAAGGTPVTLTGTNFAGPATVTFGGNSATSVVVVNATSITCVTPAHAVGAVDVVVTNPDTLFGTLPSGFTYNSSPAPPTVTTVTPSTGPIAGGTAVTIAGTGFVAGAGVTFGGVAATAVTVVNATSITCTTPSHAAGAVDVIVTNPDTQTGTKANGFTYTSASTVTVTSVTPSSGPLAGGTAVIVTGTGFATGAAVTFGGTPATGVAFVNSTRINCTTPAHAAGAVSVVVTNTDTSSGTLPSGFIYAAAGSPTVTGVTPSSGPTDGGTPVTISGTGFASGATVSFGGAAASGVSVSSTSISCTTPAHASGAVAVVVTNPDTLSGTLPNGFTYSDPLTVISINPTSGPPAGGQTLAVTGTNFVSGATVKLGGNAATAVTVLSTTLLSCVTPAHASGPVDVVVTNPDAHSATLAQAYTYGQGACTLSCVGTVPTAGVTGTAVSFQGAVQTSGGCTGTAAYAWTFGDGQGASDQNASHTFTLPGDYSWSMAASQSGANCTQYGTIKISLNVTPPTISAVTKAANPLRLKVAGTIFQMGCSVRINGVAVPTTTYKSSTLLVAKGSILKTLVPKGVQVDITVANPDGGISAVFKYTR